LRNKNCPKLILEFLNEIFSQHLIYELENLISELTTKQNTNNCCLLLGLFKFHRLSNLDTWPLLIGSKGWDVCVMWLQDAQESFSDWFEHWHNARPTPPDAQLGTTFSERVAYEHRQQQYEQELDRWQHSLDLQTKVTAQLCCDESGNC